MKLRIYASKWAISLVSCFINICYRNEWKIPSYSDDAITLPGSFPEIFFWSCLQSQYMSQKEKGPYCSTLFYSPKKVNSSFIVHFIYQLLCQMTFVYFSFKLNLSQEGKDATTKMLHKKCYWFLRELQNISSQRSSPRRRPVIWEQGPYLQQGS